MRKPVKVFSSIACNSTIASNKQRQEHNNLATIQRETTQRSPWALQEPRVRKLKELIQMQNPNKNGQGSHWGLLPYDNIEWKHELDETNTSIVNFFS